MTTDERLNNLEDQIKELKLAINHNNAVTRKVNESIKLQLVQLKTSIDQVKTQAMASNVGMGDIFSGFPGVKK